LCGISRLLVGGGALNYVGLFPGLVLGVLCVVREERVMTVRNFDFEKALRWGAGLATALYTLAFFGKLTKGYLAWSASGLDIDWSVPTNPQSMIALCFVTASMSLWFLREKGDVLAVVLFIVILSFFGYWAFLTNQIKVNMGVDRIPNTSWIGNIWLGATWLDVITFVFAIGLLGIGLVILLKRRSNARKMDQFAHNAS
jgi:hypothetical protein